MDQFIAAYKDALRRYTQFDGRLAVRGFWYFVGTNFVISFVLNLLGQASTIFWILAVVYGLALLIPSIAATVRRLHDTGRSGLVALLWLIPCVGWAVLIYFCIQPGDPNTNEYGAPVADIGT